MKNAIWIGRRQVKGLIILLALLPLIPAALLVHSMFQSTAKDYSAAVDGMNERLHKQLGLAAERFSSANVPGKRQNEDMVYFLTYVFGKHLPMEIRTVEGDLVYQSRIGTTEAASSYQIQKGEFAGWDIKIDSISDIPGHIIEARDLTIKQTVFALLGTLLIAGGVWFAVNRGLRVDEIRKDLITTISHEIKTPVSAIKLLTESLESGVLDAKTSGEYIQLISRENERIERLAARFLTYGRLEKGQFPIEKEETLLETVIEEVCGILNPRFEAAKGELKWVGDSTLNVMVDPNSLEILLNNLLENGLKYGGRPPRVLVEIDKRDAYAILTISDDGVGVPRAERKAVFRSFYRSEGRLDDGQTGAGVGLAICHRITKLIKGSLVLSDSKHPDYKGAEFCLQLPLP